MMKNATGSRRTRLTLLGLGASLAVSAAGAGSVGAFDGEPAWRPRYERVLDAARVRAQSAMLRDLELRPLPETWEQAWTSESEHYAVRQMKSRAVGLQLARGLDTMLGHFQALLGTDYAPARAFPVQIYPDLAAYNAFGNANGAEHSSFYGSFYVPGVDGDVVATYASDNPTLQRMWITHGALHQFLGAAFNTAPPVWVSEGLASYFSLYWDAPYGATELQRLRSRGGGQGLFPLRALLTAPIAQYTERPHDRLIQLGMFLTYLLHYREDTRTKAPEDAPFAEYLSLLLQGERFDDHPVHELLTERLDELEAGFRATQFAR